MATDLLNEKPKVNLNAVQLAKKKKNVLLNFYGSIKDGGEFLSARDIDLAVEALKFAKLDIIEREKHEQDERDAAALKKKMKEEARRIKAGQQRAAMRKRLIHQKHVEEVTAMDLPLDYRNTYEDDDRINAHYDDINEALLVCIDALGMVDIEFIAALTDLENKTVIEKLYGKIYQNPLLWDECFYKGWETADEYLSGNLLHKYHIAKEANEEYLGHFDANVQALEKMVRPVMDVKDIYVTLGSPWIPTDVIDDFILHLVGFERINGELPKGAEHFASPENAVRRDDVTGLWEIPNKTRFRKSSQHGRFERINYEIYGTNRMDMLYLMENILNMKTLAIFDTPDPQKKTRILNQPETVKILEKQEKMLKEFRDWLWTDPERADRLQSAYSRRYGNIKRRVYDGSFLEFPDMNPEIRLRPHQKNSVARIIFSSNTLLAHDVGAGKTYTMIAAGMELRRLGKSKKNLYVIPNNILPQWREMFLTLYPDARLLVVDRRNFNVKKRNETLKQIIDEDFDAILMAYSCFDMLSLSEDYYNKFYEEQIRLLEKASEALYSRKNIERKRLSISKKLVKLQEEHVDNICDIPFDALGINTLFVDEAHNYKNVSVHTGITRVRGLSNTGSKKCDGMMDKVHCVQRMNHGGRVVMATGTPITNSVTDIFIMQKYLQDGELEFLSIQNFDSWIAMFGNKTTEFEIDIDTNNYRLATRFSKFGNVPELAAILSNISDFYRVDHALGLPDFEGYTDSAAPGSDDFKEFLKDISLRADDVRSKRVDRKVDNLLKITGDGRKAALDMRLIDMIYGLDPNSKVVRCAENVAEIYEKTRKNKNIQMVFCDTSTPKPGFNLYDELKKLLVAMGIPEEEIAYIHDADCEEKKKLLFRDLQQGRVAVVIGSTFKMGLGVNVQKRLCALHHLDVPWRPADMVQREGRILRQGNECDSVQIYRYITKGSFDAYSWQLLEKKQKFISQILSGCILEREGDEVDEAVLNYAEVKALAVGNPLIKRKVEVTNEIDKYRMLRQDYMDDRKKKEEELNSLPERIRNQQKRIDATALDLEFYAANGNNYEQMEYEEQKAIRDTIFTAVKTKANLPFESRVLNYQGFDVTVPARMIPKDRFDREGRVKDKVPYVFVKRNGAYYMEIESNAGITKRLNNLLDNLEEELNRRKSDLENLLHRKAELEQELATIADNYVEEIEQLKQELDEIDRELGVVEAA